MTLRRLAAQVVALLAFAAAVLALAAVPATSADLVLVGLDHGWGPQTCVNGELEPGSIGWEEGSTGIASVSLTSLSTGLPAGNNVPLDPGEYRMVVTFADGYGPDPARFPDWLVIGNTARHIFTVGNAPGCGGPPSTAISVDLGHGGGPQQCHGGTLEPGSIGWEEPLPAGITGVTVTNIATGEVTGNNAPLTAGEYRMVVTFAPGYGPGPNFAGWLLTSTTAQIVYTLAYPDLTDCPQPAPVAVYRFWSPAFGNAHFFTANQAEANHIVASDPNWISEGVGFSAYPAAANWCNTGAPVYRFYSARFTSHFYTISATEKQSIITSDPQLDLRRRRVLRSHRTTPRQRPAVPVLEPRVR